MKHIKSYRVFESKGFTILEMLELGLLDWADIPSIISDLDKKDQSEVVKKLIKKYGLVSARELIKNDNIIKQVYADNPLEYLENFNNLIPKKEVALNQSMTKFVSENGDTVFWYWTDWNTKGEIWVNYHAIRDFFENIFSWSIAQSKNFEQEWLTDVYGSVISVPIRKIIPFFNENRSI